MALFNHATKEVTAKLVYYGPGLCGKSTNLQWIHDNLAFKSKGKLVSLATQTDRTLFFDFLPIELGTIRGMRARIQIYTVPGQVFYEATRRMVLKGCDAVVFVADSQAAMLDANAESLRSLRQNLLVNEIDPSIPQVIQYNKRDLPTALPLAALDERLNPRKLPAFEAVAIQGTGVEDTLKGVTKLLFQRLALHYGEGAGTAAPPPSAPPRQAAPPTQPPKPEPPGPQAQAEAPRPVERRGGSASLSTTVFAGATPAPRPERRKLALDARPGAPADPAPRGEELRPDQWLYLLDGAQRGPIDVEDLIDLVLTSIPENTKVWHPGLEGWVLANRRAPDRRRDPAARSAPGTGAQHLRRRRDARLQHRAVDAALGVDRGRGRGVPKVPGDAARRPGLHDPRSGGRRGRVAARRAEPPLDDPRRHLDARARRLRVLPPRAQPPDAVASAAALHLGLRQVQGSLPGAADRRRRLPVEEHARARAADAHPAADDALLGPRGQRAEGRRRGGRGRVPGPDRGVRRAGAPADVRAGPVSAACSRRSPRTRTRRRR